MPNLRKEMLVMLVDLYKEQIVSHAAEIDPSDRHDWESMALGWAIGRGMTVEEADEFASQAYLHQTL